MNLPGSAAASAPVGSMFLWPSEQLLRASKWRAENNPEKFMISRIAKAILALREVREASKCMEFGAAKAGASQPWHRQESAVHIVEPVIVGKKGRKCQAKDTLALYPEVVGPSPLPMSSPAVQPCRPRGATGAFDGDMSAWLVARIQRLPTSRVCGKVFARASTTMRVWSWTVEFSVQCALFAITWAPALVAMSIPLIFAAEPMLFFDLAGWVLRWPFHLVVSQLRLLAGSLRAPQQAPPVCPWPLQSFPNATVWHAPSSSGPEALFNVPPSPNLDVYPPFAAGGGALLGVALGMGGGQVFEAARGFMR